MASPERLEDANGDGVARWVLAARMDGGLPDDGTFRKERFSLPALGGGQILIRTTYISMDPQTAGEIGPVPVGVGGRLQEELLPPAELGAPIPGYVLGEVVETRDPAVGVGEVVSGYWGWQTHAVARLASSGPQAIASSTDQILGEEVVVSRVGDEVRPVSAALHILGEMGITGYVGLTVVGRPRRGDVVFVSSAAGLVGSVVGQIAKILGCRAVGSVGSEMKAAYIVDELGFDAAVNYRAQDVEQQLDAACPDGIDVYHDNVGGGLSDLVIERLRPRARVVICGATAAWTASGPEAGPRLYWPLLLRRAQVEGFSLWDHQDKYDEAFRQVAGWFKEGRLKSRETIVDGFDNVPGTFVDFLHGRYCGKVLVHVSTG